MVASALAVLSPQLGCGDDEGSSVEEAGPGNGGDGTVADAPSPADHADATGPKEDGTEGSVPDAGSNAVPPADAPGEADVEAGSDSDANPYVDASVDGDAPDGPVADVGSDVRDEFDAATGADAVDAGPESEADVVSDAEAGEGGEGGLGPTASILEGIAGSGCLACALDAGCLSPGERCEDLGTQVASAGPAVGQQRALLCEDAETCILNSLCYEEGTGVDVCICGAAADKPACESSGPVPNPGFECINTEQAGLETTDPSVEFSMETNGALGAGVANALVLCVVNSICIDCFR